MGMIARRTDMTKPAGAGASAVRGMLATLGNYDRLVDALNRLPRPALMVVTVALFAYAAIDPAGFALRMEALNGVPEPLWWLQGAVVTFYFGAREAHYHRQVQAKTPKTTAVDSPKAG